MWSGGPRAGKGAAHMVVTAVVAIAHIASCVAGNASGCRVRPIRSGGTSSDRHSEHFSVGSVLPVVPWSVTSSPLSMSWYMPLLLQTMMESCDCSSGDATAMPNDKTNHASARLARCFACRRFSIVCNYCRLELITNLINCYLFSARNIGSRLGFE